jgi:ketose-bisphosphate aldolase
MKELLEKALKGGYAVPSFCVWNAESMDTVLSVCARLRSPVILMSGPCEFQVLRPGLMAETAGVVARGYDVPAALHVDHGDSLELIKEAVEAGYTSVMLDFSTRPFEENAAALRETVRIARPLGVTVEGEIGSVGKADSSTKEGGASSTLTDPDEALRYAEATGVDALAVSIGNAHGIYTKLPQFDFERLARIHELLGIPLVLHGGSGTPDADLRRVISLGMVKVNVASEFVNSVRDSLLSRWTGKTAVWPCVALAEAMRGAAPVIERWIRKLGSDGKA